MTAKLLATLLLFIGLSAAAAPPAITLRPVASGFASPVEIANAGDGSGRLFVVEQSGRIKIVKDGAVRATPFLDISARVLCCGERGLLGLAFHPLYRSNGKFYVYYTRQTDGTIVVSEFVRSAANGDVADASTERPVLTVAHPLSNHNGGHMAFGTDGYLYIAIGDGGGGGDQDNNAQNLGVRLGKLLRIDVNVTPGFGVPPGNPFVGHLGVLPEIWDYGLRNPWKFSFDRTNGDLLIADVGQNAWEEVDLEPAPSTGGRNYGWRIAEGNHCFNPSPGCSFVGISLPIIEYGHNMTTGGFAIVGGYVYRGRKSRALRGYYLYGDNVSNHMWAASAAENWTPYRLIEGPGSISTFGEDEAGELYVARLSPGALYAIDGPVALVPTRNDFDGDGQADIFWRNISTGENYLYPMNGTQILAGEGYVRTVADQSWQVAGIGDFNGDGKADLLWRNTSTGENYIYLMNGMAIAGEGYIRTVADRNWRVAGVGDFDGDGKDDILWRNASTGENYIYLMNGTAIVGEGYVRTVADLNWQVAGVGEFNGDGKSDILWRNGVTGENYIYLMNATSIADEAYIRTVADQNWQIAGVGDFNGDGKSDILWRNGVTGENYLYPMDGTAILVAAEGYLRTVADTQWQVKGTGDYDGDGRADILWRHASSGENYLYPMAGTTIKPTEGYLRTVAEQDWQVQR